MHPFLCWRTSQSTEMDMGVMGTAHGLLGMAAEISKNLDTTHNTPPSLPNAFVRVMGRPAIGCDGLKCAQRYSTDVNVKGRQWACV